MPREFIDGCSCVPYGAVAARHEVSTGHVLNRLLVTIKARVRSKTFACAARARSLGSTKIIIRSNYYYYTYAASQFHPFDSFILRLTTDVPLEFAKKWFINLLLRFLSQIVYREKLNLKKNETSRFWKDKGRARATVILL